MITTGQEFSCLPASSNLATLSYEKYKEDVKLLKNMGMNAYRFSISWSRILPCGRGEVNQEGIVFYHNLIKDLTDNRIEPVVTLFQYDLPTALMNEYHGFLDGRIVDDFKNYCEICFKSFGEKVKNWITINEPSIYAWFGYLYGLPIPDDPVTYPYIVAHNLILAHAATATLYKQNYQVPRDGEVGPTENNKNGEISMTVLAGWYEPLSEAIADKEAAARAFSFQAGWFLEPLVYGDYPFIMKALVGGRLPTFTDEQKQMVQGSYDFIGLNYYTSFYVKSLPMNPKSVPVSYDGDQYLERTWYKDGKPIGPPVDGNPNIHVVPDGLKHLLIHLKQNFRDPKIYILENGISEPRNDELPMDKALNDKHRINFVNGHLHAIKQALRKGVNVKGYFVWALLDCMEMEAYATGNTYNRRFGLNFTDYRTVELKRYPKKSAEWISKFLSGHVMD